MTIAISVIIPNRNGSATIGKCLEAVLASEHRSFEVIVVDDCSDDGSVDIIRQFPCRLIRLPGHSGASRARNDGALRSRGRVLFFTDADCLLMPDTLSRAEKAVSSQGPGAVIGGTYTKEPFDGDFFSRFQSAFIRYSEARRPENPDYVASHAMALCAETFRKSGGFPENFLPIIEDVEFSHRLRRAGCRLAVNPQIQVRHVFNFSLARSLRNAARKARYWTMYSAGNGDLLADSGTASWALKTNVLSWLMTLVSSMAATLSGAPTAFAAVPVIIGANAWVNRGLVRAFVDAGGAGFAFRAYGYYTLIYPLAVAAGAAAGLALSLTSRSPASRKGKGPFAPARENPA